MPGFGKKNATETMLRTIMIHSAVEVSTKELDVAHVAYSQEVNNILDGVIAAQAMDLTLKEYNTVLAGMHRLIDESDFAHEITTRWRTHAARLEPEDIRRSKRIFSEAPLEPAH